MSNTIRGLAILGLVTVSAATLAASPGSSRSQTVGANQTISVGSNKTEAPATKGFTRAGGLKRTTEKVEHRSGGPKPGPDKKLANKKRKVSTIGHKHGSDQISK